MLCRVPDDNQRMKFENIFSKKVKDLEVLSQSLVYKEKEILVNVKDQIEEEDLEENNARYEKRGLLDESSDDDDDDDGFGTFQASSKQKEELKSYERHN
jgi:hypothetical protein